MKYVWVFGVSATALDGNEMFEKGSRVYVQCCVPKESSSLVEGLNLLTPFLRRERCGDIDVWSARRYEPADSDEVYPSDYLRRDVLASAQSHEPVLSVYVAGEDRASLRRPPDA